MNLAEIGGRIKSERKYQGLSQEKLAEMVNVTPHYIYEIERGLKAMSMETLANISNALNVSTDYILFGYSKKKPVSIDIDDEIETRGIDRRENAERFFRSILPYIK